MKAAKTNCQQQQGLVDGLLGLLADGTNMHAHAWAAGAVTLLDLAKGNLAKLRSWRAYSERGLSNMLLGLNNEALLDLLDKPHRQIPEHLLLSRLRSTVRARPGNFQRALADINSAIEVSCNPFYLQDWGILKQMMGDLFGALADLNEGLDLKPDDYEKLKHRGYVKCLMKDENGARSVAELALKLKPSTLELPRYELDCLGTSSVAYLYYKLK